LRHQSGGLNPYRIVKWWADDSFGPAACLANVPGPLNDTAPYLGPLSRMEKALIALVRYFLDHLEFLLNLCLLGHSPGKIITALFSVEHFCRTESGPTLKGRFDSVC
jgi:hypothetical protein